MKKTITLSVATLFLGLSQQVNSQIVIENDSVFMTKSQMFLANELFESGEPFAEALGYNLDLLDPMTANSPDSISYTTGIEGYEYSRYLLNTLNGRSGMGLHMMWSPIISANAAMQGAAFDGTFTGGTANGYKEDDMLMMMIGNFGANANFTPFANPFPQFAEFTSGNTNLPQTVQANYLSDFGSSRWDRSKMDKTLNLAGMGQSMWKQYWWAQDMLGSFHDGNEDDVVPDGTNSPDLIGSPNFDPANNIYYGGNNVDGFIGQILTAESINKTKFLVTNMAYDGASLGMVDPATYDPANGIKYFPTKIAVTESNVLAGLPPKMSTLTVTDASSQIFDQLSFLLATTSYVDMMDPNNANPDHYAYQEVFDGFPFPSAMGFNGATVPGPYNLMKGTSKVIFLNVMAMHYNATEGTFVNSSTLDGSGNAVLGTDISAENAAYIIKTLVNVSNAFTGSPLQTMADNAIVSQANYILANFKDANGGFYNSFTVGTGADNGVKTIAANAAILSGLYAAYEATNDATYLTAANDGYNFMINNFYVPSKYVYKTEMGNHIATYTPWNMALVAGALRQASLVGSQTDAAAIYTRISKNVFNKMILSEGDATGETGGDSDGDGIPYIVGGTKPFVFAAKGTNSIEVASIENNSILNYSVSIFPNPTTDHISVSINLDKNAIVGISIYDLNGRLITSTKQNAVNGEQSIVVGVSNIASGNYIIKTTLNNEPISIDKLIIK